MTKGEQLVWAACFAVRNSIANGENLEEKAEYATREVLSLASIDVEELTPAAAAMVKEMRGETT